MAARLLAMEAKLLLCLSLDKTFFWETLESCVRRLRISDYKMEIVFFLPNTHTHVHTCNCSSCSPCALCILCCLLLKSLSFSDASAFSWQIYIICIGLQHHLCTVYKYLFVLFSYTLVLLCQLLLQTRNL